ncbi:MAG: WYL domain-containing protein [Candidatus Kapabacteria bacterium]|nr:WYL domain-containing protein [Candidatus Kapabacteria bacterium]
MPEKNKENFEQARRVLFIFKRLLSGETFTVKELQQELSEKFYSISERTIQRDLKLVQEMDESVERFHQEHQIVWKMSNYSKSKSESIKISENEMFSYYVLKAYLKNFKGTIVEDEINKLTTHLENIAPGDALAEATLISEQNFGQYNYGKYNDIILTLIRFINEKSWISFNYTRIVDAKTASYQVFPQCLFIYSGSVYLIAYYKKKNSFRSFAIQNIKNLEEYQSTSKVPEFSLQEFSKFSFGAHSGEPVDITLHIKQEYVKYFENRFWHISQKFKIQKDETAIIEMKVPIVPELINWVCSWHEAIKVIKPIRLIDEVQEALELALKNYKN